MTILRVWHGLLYVGDGAVLLPCAALLFAWLVATPSTLRTACWWLAAVLLVGGGVALSKLLYMISGWCPAGWNFIGLSGHAALSFLFWPAAAALVTSSCNNRLRVVAVALGACLALAISAASWMLRTHSLVEVVLGGLWGALVAAVFLKISWRQEAQAPLPRLWIIASMLLLLVVAYRHQLPSTRVLGRIALQVSGHSTIHTRADLGPQARLSSDTARASRHSRSLQTSAHARYKDEHL